MTQAQTDTKKPVSTLGAAAAAAATTTPATTNGSAHAAKPTETPASSAASTDDDKKLRTARKVYVVVGTVHEFESANKAEKFLNDGDAPAEYAVIRGNRIGTSKKVSLR